LVEARAIGRPPAFFLATGKLDANMTVSATIGGPRFVKCGDNSFATTAELRYV
jgi:hypothetical protein